MAKNSQATQPSEPTEELTGQAPQAADPVAASPATTITIQGLQFDVPAPYADGHVCDANEAIALNQVFAENIRNNFSARIKKLHEKLVEQNSGNKDVEFPEDVKAELRTQLAEYSAEYKFNGRRMRAEPIDPVGKEALKIARDIVREHLKKKNVDIKSLDEGVFDDLVDQVMEKYPAVREEAAARIAKAKSVASSVLESLSA